MFLISCDKFQHRIHFLSYLFAAPFTSWPLLHFYPKIRPPHTGELKSMYSGNGTKTFFFAVKFCWKCCCKNFLCISSKAVSIVRLANKTRSLVLFFFCFLCEMISKFHYIATKNVISPKETRNSFHQKTFVWLPDCCEVQISLDELTYFLFRTKSTCPFVWISLKYSNDVFWRVLWERRFSSDDQKTQFTLSVWKHTHTHNCKSSSSSLVVVVVIATELYFPNWFQMQHTKSSTMNCLARHFISFCPDSSSF